MYIVIRNMSADNEETGETWQETKVFAESSTLKKVMDWAESDQIDAGYSRKRITITRPHED